MTGQNGMTGGGADAGDGHEAELSASLTPFDTDVEGALRPRSLGEFIGQEPSASNSIWSSPPPPAAE